MSLFIQLNANHTLTLEQADLSCPLLGQLWIDPHVASDGYSYSKRALYALLASPYPRSPVTGELLQYDCMVKNHTLSALVALYQQREQGLPLNSAQGRRALTCMLSAKVFRQPVFLADGYSYESQDLKKWLQSFGTSPQTRDPIVQNEVLADCSLKKILQKIIRVESVQRQHLQKIQNSTRIYQQVLYRAVRTKAARPILLAYHAHQTHLRPLQVQDQAMALLGNNSLHPMVKAMGG